MRIGRRRRSIVDQVFWMTGMMLSVGIFAKSVAVRELTLGVAACVLVSAVGLLLWRRFACRR